MCRKNPLQVYCFATNESSSYLYNLITAPTESNYWSSCDTFALSLQDLCTSCCMDNCYFLFLSRQFPKNSLEEPLAIDEPIWLTTKGGKPNYSLREPSKQNTRTVPVRPHGNSSTCRFTSR